MELSNTLPSIRLRMDDSSDALPKPVSDPLHGWSFPYAVTGYYLPATSPPNNWQRRFQVYVQKREHFSLARRACRFLLRCLEFALVRLERDHPLMHKGIYDLYLCAEGKAGAEQTRNSLYLYQIDPNLPEIEWARELAHEYGHAIVPPINSFTEPEAWANGDLGERLFLNWCLQDLRARRLTPDDLMNAKETDIERYRARLIEPLIGRMVREGLHPGRWRSKRKDGYEEYLALALYTEQIYGTERLRRAMLIAGGTEPEHFLRGLRDSLQEMDVVAVTLPQSPAWLLLPGGLKHWRALDSNLQLTPDPKRPDWVRVQVKTTRFPIRLHFRPS